jgi:radical SAM superfamily enzyme YgiQ (UPF0313 family)
LKKVLLIEPSGGFIRLDRCMQSVDSWGGVYRFPLNLARIAAHLLSLGHQIKFIDLQADKTAILANELLNFEPDLCILSSGFPSMQIDAHTANDIKAMLPNVHISTFGVVPTLLKETFFEFGTWGFDIPFDSAVTGGEPSLGYESLLSNNLNASNRIIDTSTQKLKSIETYQARILFNNDLYRSPFTNENATYIDGTYGCPYTCSFCVVPELYGNRLSKRSPQAILPYGMKVQPSKKII